MAKGQTMPTLFIQHVATGLVVFLQDYLMTEFQDTIDTKYNSVNAYGRMDPILNYQGSTRKISLGLQKLTPSDAYLGTISKLQKMQYPVYKKGSNALTIQRPPLVKVKFANLIKDGDGQYLLCAMNGFAFTPKAGFTPEDSPLVRFGKEKIRGSGGKKTTSFDKDPSKDIFNFMELSLKFDFTVLHRYPMGFSNDPQYSGIADPHAGTYQRYVGDKDIRFLGGDRTGPVATEWKTNAGKNLGSTGKASEFFDDALAKEAEKELDKLFKAVKGS